jgi:hypothetical protein
MPRQGKSGKGSSNKSGGHVSIVEQAFCICQEQSVLNNPSFMLSVGKGDLYLDEEKRGRKLLNIYERGFLNLEKAEK